MTHWAEGGETKLEKLILMGRFHHRLVHEEGYTVNCPRGKRPYFLDPSMRLLRDVPPPPPPLPPRMPPPRPQEPRTASLDFVATRPKQPPQPADRKKPK